MRSKDLKAGAYVLYEDDEFALGVVKLTKVMDNDLARFFVGECVLTGKKVVGGLYTDENFARIKCVLTEMEVLAWLAR
jgi:hypothetical protein